MFRINALAFALIALLFVPNAASARLGGAPFVAHAVSHKQDASFGHFHKFKKFKHFKHFKHMKKPTASGSTHNNQWGGYVAGATLCMVVWPMINAAAGNPEPTSEQMLQHVAGCWFPPLAVIQFLQNQGAF